MYISILCYFSSYEVAIIISVQSICIPFVFSAAVGIFFGFYPAYKASKLEHNHKRKVGNIGFKIKEVEDEW